MLSPLAGSATEFSLLAVLCWGTSDFTGGYASRQSDAFLVTALTHLSGVTLMTGLALGLHAPLPDRSSEFWALAAGAIGGVALAIFYRALSRGRMGLTAPVAAVLGAAIPTLFGIAVEGVPGVARLIGFVCAAVGIWLISRVEDDSGRPEGIGLALLAGLGFAGFYLCIHQVGNSSATWSAAHSRLASLIAVGAIVALRPGKHALHRRNILLGLFAGLLDSTGTLLFIRADQTGRLDSAVVLTSLYPAVTVLLARVILKEHFTRWKAVGIFAALLAVGLIAAR
jgi:drug/metabolite transporter (DMT)-like permease